MMLFSRPVGEYCSETRVGVGLLILIGFVRFLMLPVFGVPYEGGTTFTSLTLLTPLLVLFYSFRASQRPGTTYRDMFGIAFVLATAGSLLIAASIAVDDFGGIDTYFTDPAHGGSLNPFLHIGGHLLGIPIGTLLYGGLGSLIRKLFGRNS